MISTNHRCATCGANSGAVCRRMDCAQLRPKSFTSEVPLAKGLAADPVDMLRPAGGAFVELPCIACHGQHAPGEGCGH